MKTIIMTKKFIHLDDLTEKQITEMFNLAFLACRKYANSINLIGYTKALFSIEKKFINEWKKEKQKSIMR